MNWKTLCVGVCFFQWPGIVYITFKNNWSLNKTLNKTHQYNLPFWWLFKSNCSNHFSFLSVVIGQFKFSTFSRIRCLLLEAYLLPIGLSWQMFPTKGQRFYACGLYSLCLLNSTIIVQKLAWQWGNEWMRLRFNKALSMDIDFWILHNFHLSQNIILFLKCKNRY